MNAVVQRYLDEAKANTEGLSEDSIDVYHAMCDNQGKELSRIAEQTTTANIDRISTVFLPAIKKLARDSIVSRIVGVQPITDRVALLQFVDYVYSNAHPAEGLPNVSDTALSAGDSAVTGVSTNYSNAPGEGQNITQMLDYIIREEGVKARQRKLAGRWTFEAQDSSNKYGINLENEITKALASKIVDEVNFEFINELYTRATGGTAAWQAPLIADSPATKDRKEKELYYTVIDVAAEMYDKSKRYPNFVVMNPRTAAYFKRSGDYISPTGTTGNVNAIKRLFSEGTLNDEFAMYVVPNLATNDILVGYKGPSEIEVGAIYAPYIPLVIMDSFYNVENWTWLRSVGSFYAKAFPMMSLYGKVTVSLT